MKNILIAILTILLFALFGLIYTFINHANNQVKVPGQINLLFSSTTQTHLNEIGQITIGDNTWQVEIAKTELKQITGLSKRKTLPSNQGMLFIFNELSVQSFWMKDMLLPIDMIFFDDNWRIVLIEQNIQPNTFPKVFGNSVRSQYVLEMNALESKSANLQVGDQAVFSE